MSNDDLISQARSDQAIAKELANEETRSDTAAIHARIDQLKAKSGKLLADIMGGATND